MSRKKCRITREIAKLSQQMKMASVSTLRCCVHKRLLCHIVLRFEIFCKVHLDQHKLVDNLKFGPKLFQNLLRFQFRDFFFNPPFLQSVSANYKKEKTKETGFSIHPNNRIGKGSHTTRENIQNCKIITMEKTNIR